MNRILSCFLSLAFCASLGSIAAASSNSTMATKVKHHMMSENIKCAKKNQVFVHGYMKNGKWVKGYCRKK